MKRYWIFAALLVAMGSLWARDRHRMHAFIDLKTVYREEFTEPCKAIAESQAMCDGVKVHFSGVQYAKDPEQQPTKFQAELIATH